LRCASVRECPPRQELGPQLCVRTVELPIRGSCTAEDDRDEEFACAVFSGSQGTLAVRQQLTFTAAASNGVWEVASGTGAYESASGHGTFEFVFPDNLTFTGVISKAP
jgi:hypothetical protein